MEFCVSRNVLGTEKHLFRTGDGWSWRKAFDQNLWTLTHPLENKTSRSLNDLFRLNGLSVNVSPPARFFRTFDEIGLNSFIMWSQSMPRDEFKTFLKGVVSNVEGALGRTSTVYHDTVWTVGNGVLGSLVTAKANKSEYEALIRDATVQNKHSIKTFQPQNWGNLSPIVYDRFGTRTGRLTVDSGPMILTVKKEFRRRLVKSRYDDGRIVEIDFSNLEPRVLLEEAGRTCSDPDLYETLNHDEFNGKALRDVVKASVISQLYGMSTHALCKKLNMPIDIVSRFVKTIRERFKIENLLKRLKLELVNNGHITNRFGRIVPIDVPLDRILVNSYAQSTAADVAMLGFHEILKRFDGTRVKPLFLIVDAILLDVHPEDMTFVKTLRSVDVNGTTFPVKITVY